MKEEIAMASVVYYDREGMWIFDSMLDLHYKLNLMDDRSRDDYEKNMNLGSYAPERSNRDSGSDRGSGNKSRESRLKKIISDDVI